MSVWPKQWLELGVGGAHNWQVSDETGDDVYWDPSVRDRKSLVKLDGRGPTLGPCRPSLTSRRNVSVCVNAVVLLLTAFSGAVAQEERSGVSEQLWVDYNPRWTDRKQREIFGDIGFRTLLGDNQWVRFVARPGVRGPVGAFRLAGGIGTFYRLNKSGADVLEVRPFQGISATWPRLKRVRFQHYVRLEQRFEWETANWTFTSSLRARYRLQAEFSFSGFRSGSDWRVVLHAEPFFTLAGNAGQVDEQLRIGLGAGRNVGSVMRLRADLTWEKAGLDFFEPSDHFYLRFRIYQGWLRRLTTDDG